MIIPNFCFIYLLPGITESLQNFSSHIVTDLKTISNLRTLGQMLGDLRNQLWIIVKWSIQIEFIGKSKEMTILIDTNVVFVYRRTNALLQIGWCCHWYLCNDLCYVQVWKFCFIFIDDGLPIYLVILLWFDFDICMLTTRNKSYQFSTIVSWWS